jgi:hypothetical protein
MPNTSLHVIPGFQLCNLFADGGWTVERDDDLTAPYSFKNDSWIAFDDRISVGIKVTSASASTVSEDETMKVYNLRKFFKPLKPPCLLYVPPIVTH